MTYKKFEDLRVWNDSRDLNKLLHSILKSNLGVEYGFIVNHMYKTAGSIMDNIAEGFEREGNKEFIHFVSISKGSCGELRSQLYRAFDIDLIGKNDFDRLKLKTEEISTQLNRFMNYLNKSNIKGNKFREQRSEYSISEADFFL